MVLHKLQLNLPNLLLFINYKAIIDKIAMHQGFYNLKIIIKLEKLVFLLIKPNLKNNKIKKVNNKKLDFADFIVEISEATKHESLY